MEPAQPPPQRPASDRRETRDEQLDRNWSELLQELRVTQTGVQILTGFLLTVPFQARFGDLTAGYRALFLTAMGLSTLATCLIVAPVSAHRLLFRRHEKEDLVRSGSALAKAGLVCLALTVTCVLVLIFGVVANLAAGLCAGAVTLVVFVLFWVVLPVRLGRNSHH